MAPDTIRTIEAASSAIVAAQAAIIRRCAAILKQPPLSAPRVPPLRAKRAIASDDLPPPRSSSTSSVSAVEAGRPANNSAQGEPCNCRVCTSGLADIVPCEREKEQ